VRVGGPGAQAAERAHVNNFGFDFFRASGAFAAHPFQGFAGDQERAASVGGEDGVPLAEGEALEIGSVVVGGVVDEDVDASEFAPGIFHHGLDAGFIGDVAAQGEGAHAVAGEIDDGLLGFAGGIEIGEGDVGAGLGQGESGGASQAAGGAGDEAGLAAEGFGGVLRHGEFYRGLRGYRSSTTKPRKSSTTKDTKLHEGLNPADLKFHSLAISYWHP